MKAKRIITELTLLSLLLFVSGTRAADITATGSGNWSSTVPDAPWPGGVVPGTNDDVDVEAPYEVTVDSTAFVQYIYGSGTVTMAPGATLVVTDPTGGSGTDQLQTLNATATGNTVIYACNPFWAKECDYYNLVFANTNYVPLLYVPFENFNNFSRHGATPMNIAGNMTVMGYTKVQQGSGGAPISIGGNLVIGTNCVWDTSGDDLTVASNLYVYGLLEDLNGALGTNYFAGNVAILGAGSNAFSTKLLLGAGWYVSDVITWGIGGNLTNNGDIFGTGFGSIAFEGTGVITGTNTLTLPTMTVDGTYKIGTTVVLFTNTPTLNGTLVFDIARTNQVVLLTNAGTALYFNGDLNVINSGAPPNSGDSYTLFTSLNGFGGVFFSPPTFPDLRPNLYWIDNTYFDGSISVGGTLLAPLVLSIANNGPGSVKLTWDSATYPGYIVQGQTNRSGPGPNWSNSGSGTTGSFVVATNPTNPPVFFRLYHP